jgi:hypothetical protein
MTQINMEEIMGSLSPVFKKALDDTMAQFAPSAVYDSNDLFRFFAGRVCQLCSVWEKVPDRCAKVT